MANSQLANRLTANNKSGTSELYKYHQLYKFEDIKNMFMNRLCYVIRHYGNSGVSITIRRAVNDQVVVMFGDWNGNILELNDLHKQFISDRFPIILTLMKNLKIQHIQLYFVINNNIWVLVDGQQTQSKLIGPGMLRDIFGKILDVQEILKVEALNEETMKMIDSGTGSYNGDLIIKPSLFKTYESKPMYAEVKR